MKASARRSIRAMFPAQKKRGSRGLAPAGPHPPTVSSRAHELLAACFLELRSLTAGLLRSWLSTTQVHNYSGCGFQ